MQTRWTVYFKRPVTLKYVKGSSRGILYGGHRRARGIVRTLTKRTDKPLGVIANPAQASGAISRFLRSFRLGNFTPFIYIGAHTLSYLIPTIPPARNRGIK
jgi:hypothetical protein